MVDVVVIDGFIGNVVLKFIEGMVMNMMDLLKFVILNEGIKGKMGVMFLKDGLCFLKFEMDYFKYGGVVLFGLKVLVIKIYGVIGFDVVCYMIC